MSYTNKTQSTKQDPIVYVQKHFKGKEKVQKEALSLIELYSTITGSSCVMWNKIFGFGRYDYSDSTGGEHTYLMTGFAVSSTGFTLYNILGWNCYAKEIKKLGTYKLSGKSCLAIRSIEQIDRVVLKQVLKRSVADMRKKYKTHR